MTIKCQTIRVDDAALRQRMRAIARSAAASALTDCAIG
jgi:hypothetical protein